MQIAWGIIPVFLWEENGKEGRWIYLLAEVKALSWKILYYTNSDI